jgi:signal transduction histidine kinase
MELKLRGSIVGAIVIGLLIPATVGSLLTLGQREQALTHELMTDHQRMTEILALGMQQPLWNLSVESARPLFDSMLRDKRVTELEVRDRKFGTFLEAKRPERRRGRQFTLTRDVVYGGDVIGNVLVQVDSGDLDAVIAHNRSTFELTVLCQLLLSLALIVALLRIRLLLPLQQLIRQSQKLARRELNEPFRWLRDDELGSLGRSLESTRQSLRELFDEIEAKNRALESDIARRRQTEAELQQHREHLEELVRARTAELTIAKERAEVASQAKSAFLASMSHELRTPLNAVLGYTQLLKRSTNLTSQQRASLDTIQQSGEHLLTLINDLLDLAKIEAGKFELVETAVDLLDFLRRIADILRVRAEQKGLSFSFEAAPDLPPFVLLDDKRLRQVLLNLLGNAVRFTDRGSVRLHVSAGRCEDGATGLRFEISDTGVGIAPAEQERIFEPFEQAGDAQQRHGGTGLGLSISRQLVRLMGGEIRVESAPGNGSAFRFDVPVRLPPSPVTQSVTKPETHDATQIVYTDTFDTPPADEMERLHRLALAGNMRAIRKYAVDLAAVQPRYAAFAERLDVLARQYQSKAVLELVEACMH